MHRALRLVYLYDGEPLPDAVMEKLRSRYPDLTRIHVDERSSETLWEEGDIFMLDLAECKGQALPKTLPRCSVLGLIDRNDAAGVEAMTGRGVYHFITKPVKEAQLFEILGDMAYHIRSQREMVAEQQYFKALTESSIVSKSDIHGTITYVNENLCRISGYAPEELIGKSHNIFRHTATQDTVYEEMWSTILEGKVWRGRMINKNKDGSDFVSETIIIPLKDEKGEFVEFIAIRNDITQLLALEKKMRFEKQEAVQNRKISEAKRSFLILFTHELKTPLNAIINFSKYIQKHLDSDKELERAKLLRLLGSVISNATDVLENITGILEISKLNEQKLTYHKERFALGTTVRSSMEKFASLISDKNGTLDAKIDDDIYIYNDEYRVRQIFSNVLSNAVKYGNGKILVTLRRNKNMVELIIEDNGPGIPDKVKVFELYEQGDTSLMNRKAEGTGIGLHLTKLLCDELGIVYMLLDSDRLGGTKFVLRFFETGRTRSGT